jgi:hypothetical protein
VAEEVPERETKRQYRVLQQTLSAHAFLRDDYARNARWAKIALTAFSILFCATTFAGDEFYTTLGVDPDNGRFVVGLVSIAAVIVSVTLLIVDWDGKSERHKEDAKTWSAALKEFRMYRGDGDSWPADRRVHLNAVYWEADQNSSNIPARHFNVLKSRHLRKVAVSELKSDYPGCPRVLLSLFLRGRDTYRAFNSVRNARDGDGA